MLERQAEDQHKSSSPSKNQFKTVIDKFCMALNIKYHLLQQVNTTEPPVSCAKQQQSRLRRIFNPITLMHLTTIKGRRNVKSSSLWKESHFGVNFTMGSIWEPAKQSDTPWKTLQDWLEYQRRVWMTICSNFDSEGCMDLTFLRTKLRTLACCVNLCETGSSNKKE